MAGGEGQEKQNICDRVLRVINAYFCKGYCRVRPYNTARDKRKHLVEYNFRLSNSRNLLCIFADYANIRGMDPRCSSPDTNTRAFPVC